MQAAARLTEQMQAECIYNVDSSSSTDTCNSVNDEYIIVCVVMATSGSYKGSREAEGEEGSSITPA